ncbi:tRNA (adenosine(37)-N6)-threonylcarbamoyltransferase complex ATPase subunit type 1 TsaE [Candidatus Falkowbacteria bacterium RBG_13_39_14]|uniref:tRNA threonylcarbamoyladenosine biosynthesis protein TsaE n=1 Tax=Candidatus Falkowbacteria bacterium RBG_13_39_14 TaxID=1797985 RepID=A0A1F5S6N8_9BACT|nr:MAG: tRNA (adenosine(37)-N6)-threonylcarbamoyltransferase complex ATPase subunit type 1 TsaE [Candidatus Falkowbacteria bacterium RBG_13_39_14]
MRYISHNEQDTKKIGKKISAKLKGGEVLALHGDLGAGKTVLAKGIAEGLGYKKIVNSPTFVLMKVYKINCSTSAHTGKVNGVDVVHAADEKKFEIRNLKLEIKKNPMILKNICHIDTYRISDAREIEDIGALEFFGNPQTVSIVEWPEKIKKLLPQDTIWIELKYGKGENEREIVIRGN